MACFPIKPVRLPLLLLPGPGFAFVFMCVASELVHRLCVCWFAYTSVSMERYRKCSLDHPHQSPTQKEMERGIDDRKKDGGHHRKKHPERGRGESEEKWMEQSRLALIELGSVVYILYR